MHFCNGESSTSAFGGELGVPVDDNPPSAPPPELLLVLELPELSAMFNKSKLQSCGHNKEHVSFGVKKLNWMKDHIVLQFNDI
jgi:hypothetical protein